MTRTAMLGVSAAAFLAVGVGGWAAAAALIPSHTASSDGRVMQVRYEVRREAAYVPPATEAGRLDVLNPQSPTVIEDGVLSAQAGQALRSLQAEDDARTAAALASIRAQDARIDRNTAAALSTDRADASDDAASAPARTDG